MAEFSPGENFQRVGVLAFVPGLLLRFGVNPVEVLAAAGLSAHALDNPEACIPYVAAGRLLEVAAEKTHCPHFGLEVGKKLDTTSLGLVGQLMRNAPTVGAAILDFASHQHRNAHGGVVYVLLDNHQAFFGYAIYQPNVPGNDLICDLAASAACNLIYELVGTGHKHAMELLLARSQPLDLMFYQQAFGVKLRFNAEQTALVFRRAFLDLPVIGADANLRKVLQQRVAEIWHAGQLDMVTRLRRELRVALISNQVSGDEIAAHMGMSRRTFHRRLEECGVTFQDILHETRCEFAKQLLINTRLSIGEIATIVGYAEPSTLTRRFICWMGVSPSEWRANIATSGLNPAT